MSVPYTRISLLSASHVSTSYSAKIGCISSVNTRTSSAGPTHVPRFLFTDELRVKFWTLNSSLFASHISSPYSVQIDCKPIANTRISFLALVMFSPIFRTDKMYVGSQYTNYITWSESWAVLSSAKTRLL